MKVTDAIELLKKSLTELKLEMEKSKTAYEKDLQIMGLLSGTFKGDTVENNKTVIKLGREGFFDELELFRTEIRIIEKMSPESARKISEMVNKYEKTGMDMFSRFESFIQLQIKKMPISKEEHESVVKNLVVLSSNSSNIKETISLCRNCINDTLQKLESMLKN